MQCEILKRKADQPQVQFIFSFLRKAHGRIRCQKESPNPPSRSASSLGNTLQLDEVPLHRYQSSESLLPDSPTSDTTTWLSVFGLAAFHGAMRYLHTKYERTPSGITWKYNEGIERLLDNAFTVTFTVEDAKLFGLVARQFGIDPRPPYTTCSQEYCDFVMQSKELSSSNTTVLEVIAKIRCYSGEKVSTNDMLNAWDRLMV